MLKKKIWENVQLHLAFMYFILNVYNNGYINKKHVLFVEHNIRKNRFNNYFHG